MGLPLPADCARLDSQPVAGGRLRAVEPLQQPPRQLQCRQKVSHGTEPSSVESALRGEWGLKQRATPGRKMNSTTSQNKHTNKQQHALRKVEVTCRYTVLPKMTNECCSRRRNRSANGRRIAASVAARSKNRNKGGSRKLHVNQVQRWGRIDDRIKGSEDYGCSSNESRRKPARHATRQTKVNHLRRCRPLWRD